jgi:hypothetical protein
VYAYLKLVRFTSNLFWIITIFDRSTYTRNLTYNYPVVVAAGRGVVTLGGSALTGATIGGVAFGGDTFGGVALDGYANGFSGAGYAYLKKNNFNFS